MQRGIPNLKSPSAFRNLAQITLVPDKKEIIVHRTYRLEVVVDVANQRETAQVAMITIPDFHNIGIVNGTRSRMCREGRHYIYLLLIREDQDPGIAVHSSRRLHGGPKVQAGNIRQSNQDVAIIDGALREPLIVSRLLYPKMNSSGPGKI